MRKGQAVPVMFFAERTTPYATARLLVVKFSLRERVVGLYTKVAPMAASTPCVTTSCHTCVAKAESRKLTHCMITPAIAACLLRCMNRRLNKEKSIGMDRYMTPFDVVPMTPKEL